MENETKAIAIRLPEFERELTIAPEWIQKRDEILSSAGMVRSVTTQDEFDIAAELLNRITKTSNKAESMRKDLGKPFLEAGRLIKEAADSARNELEYEKVRIKKILAIYANEQDRRRREEQAAADEAEREALAASRAKEAAATQAAADLGIKNEQTETFQSAAPSKPTTVEAKSDSVRVQVNVIWEVVDQSKIPRSFLAFDPRLVNAYLREHKDKFKETLEAGGDGSGLIDGLAFKLDRQVSGR